MIPCLVVYPKGSLPTDKLVVFAVQVDMDTALVRPVLQKLWRMTQHVNGGPLEGYLLRAKARSSKRGDYFVIKTEGAREAHRVNPVGFTLIAVCTTNEPADWIGVCQMDFDERKGVAPCPERA